MNFSVVFEMWRSPCSLHVRGLFSAIVPDSSLVGVRRVLVPHMEDEDDQENEKEYEREDGKQRVEGRRESSNTQHERMDGMK